MLPQPQLFRRARSQWHKHYNSLLAYLSEKGPSKQFKRLVTQGERAGQVQIVSLTGKPFSTGCKDTGTLLIQRAIKSVTTMRSLNLLEYDDDAQLPEGAVIEVNCVELGKKRSLSSRTIRTHIKQLMDAGLILRKKFHGWRKNLELTINAKFVWAIEQNAEKIVQKQPVSTTQPAVPLTPQSTKFPPIKGLETLRSNKILIPSVEKLATYDQQRPGDTFFGNTGSCKPEPEAEKGLSGGAGGTIAAQPTPEAIAAQLASDVEKATLLTAYGEEFWFTAWKLLYPRFRFSPAQIKLAKSAIYAGVYRHLDTSVMSLADWKRYHAQAMRRLLMVSRYLAKYPEKRIRMPYAEYSPGTGYFDAENAQGFIGTEAWLAEAEARRYQQRIIDRLDQARTEFTQFKDLKRGLKIKACKRVKTMGGWELFRWHENRIRQAGGTEALEKFYALTVVSRQQFTLSSSHQTA